MVWGMNKTTVATGVLVVLGLAGLAVAVAVAPSDTGPKSKVETGVRDEAPVEEVEPTTTTAPFLPPPGTPATNPDPEPAAPPPAPPVDVTTTSTTLICYSPPFWDANGVFHPAAPVPC